MKGFEDLVGHRVDGIYLNEDDDALWLVTDKGIFKTTAEGD